MIPIKKTFKYQKITDEGLETIAVVEAPTKQRANLIANFHPKMSRELKLKITEIKRYPFHKYSRKFNGFKFLFF